MFDFAWSEIVLIGAVALIAIGPKDMPAAIRTVSGMIKKARRMAAEFQTHVDEMVREADLGDVKKAFNDIRNLDLAGALEKHVDPDRSIRSTFAEDPFKPTYPTASPISNSSAVSELEVAASQPGSTFDSAGAAFGVAAPSEAPVSESSVSETSVSEPLVKAELQGPLAPAWMPPELVPPPVPPAAGPAEAPAFIPPDAVTHRHAKA